MTLKSWLILFGFLSVLTGQYQIYQEVKSSKKNMPTENRCVIDGRAVYCILPEVKNGN